MSRIRVERITNKEGTGAPLFPNGIRVVGLTSLSNVVAGVTTFTSDVSIGGTLTYEDVTNIDSVGMVTARNGIKVLAGGINVVGVITATSYDGIDSTSLKDSSGNIKAQATSAGIGIGTNIPASELHVMQSKSGGSSHASSQLTLERDGTNYLQFMTANNGTSGLLFGDVADNDGTAIKYDHNTSLMLFNTEASERLRIGSAGQIGIAGANYGTSGQVLTSGGGSAAPSWADAGGGAWELLQSASNPNTSTVDFVGLTTAYAAYKVQFMGANINSSNSREMRCRIYLGGAVQTGNSYRHMSNHVENGSNSVAGYGGLYDAIILSGSGSGSRGYNGELTFPMKLRTSGSVDSLQAFYGFCVTESYGNSIRGYHQGSYSNLLTGIRFDSPDNYNVTDGQFYLYGLTRT